MNGKEKALLKENSQKNHISIDYNALTVVYFIIFDSFLSVFNLLHVCLCCFYANFLHPSCGMHRTRTRMTKNMAVKSAL